MTQNATVHPRHKDEMLRLWRYEGMLVEDAQAIIAQTIADLEAARAESELLSAKLELEKVSGIGMSDALAEIDEIAARYEVDHGYFTKIRIIAAPYRASDPRYGSVHTDGSRSGGQPVTSCPDCEAFKAEVSATICEAMDLTIMSHEARAVLSRFIIPPADPVAEALADVIALEDWATEDRKTVGVNFREALKKHGFEVLRLPLGGA